MDIGRQSYSYFQGRLKLDGKLNVKVSRGWQPTGQKQTSALKNQVYGVTFTDMWIFERK